jgi:NAD-dependent deacetylase
MERSFPRVWTLTQNVDGFHRDAGSANLIEIHGNLRHIRCTSCPHRFTVSDYSAFDERPVCPNCSSLLRPDVVLFGETLPESPILELKQQLHEGFDLTFSIGTTSVFPYISFPMQLAVQRGKPSVEINPGSTAVSRLATYRLELGAAVALNAIWTSYQGARNRG